MHRRRLLAVAAASVSLSGCFSDEPTEDDSEHKVNEAQFNRRWPPRNQPEPDESDDSDEPESDTNETDSETVPNDGEDDGFDWDIRIGNGGSDSSKKEKPESSINGSSKPGVLGDDP